MTTKRKRRVYTPEFREGADIRREKGMSPRPISNVEPAEMTALGG